MANEKRRVNKRMRHIILWVLFVGGCGVVVCGDEIFMSCIYRARMMRQSLVWDDYIDSI